MAFADLEKRSRKALKTLYEHGLEKSLATDEDGPAQLLPLLVEALEEVIDGVGPMVEAEARVLSSAALTCVLRGRRRSRARSSGGFAEEVPWLCLRSFVRRCR